MTNFLRHHYKYNINVKVPVKGKGGVQLLIANPSQSCRASPALWDHTVLAVKRHR